jgi:hypothetical protein
MVLLTMVIITLVILLILRMYWVYRVNSMAIDTVSVLAKRHLNKPKNYQNEYDIFLSREMSLWAMFWRLTKWRLSDFYPYLAKI